jgi:hypothetical protein
VAGEKDAPLAAILCYGTGSLTFIGGVLALLDRSGELYCWYGIQLAGAAVTTLLGITSLLRREEWKLWTVLCVLAALAPMVIDFLRAK